MNGAVYKVVGPVPQIPAELAADEAAVARIKAELLDGLPGLTSLNTGGCRSGDRERAGEPQRRPTDGPGDF